MMFHGGRRNACMLRNRRDLVILVQLLSPSHSISTYTCIQNRSVEVVLFIYQQPVEVVVSFSRFVNRWLTG